MRREMRTCDRLTRAYALGALCSLTVAAGCASPRPSALTPGAAKKHLVRGQTTQAQVIEIFGTPNIITITASGEMWVYDKISSRITSAAIGGGGVGGGAGSSGGGAGGVGFGVGSTERSETTVMLIVYFDENDVVKDYKISQTKF